MELEKPLSGFGVEEIEVEGSGVGVRLVVTPKVGVLTFEESVAVEAAVNAVLEDGVGLVALEVRGVTGVAGGVVGGVTLEQLCRKYGMRSSHDTTKY